MVKKTTMEELLAQSEAKVAGVKPGDTIEATVISIGKNKIWLDVEGKGLGFVPETEMIADDEIKKGDKILAYVIKPEDEEGYLVLSLRRADKDRIWYSLKNKFETGESLVVKIIEANRGGLMVETGGVRGFLPVSQLSSEHYPRVEGGDKNKILAKLSQYVGQKMIVKIIGLDKSANKLIFSEKAIEEKSKEKVIQSIKVGEVVEGEITGIVDFGLFIKFTAPDQKSEVEGLIHISEVSWERVEDLKERFSVGDKVKAKIVSIEEGRISLSIKQLLPDPWVKAIKKYKIDQIVEGKVTRVTPFGAFVEIAPQIEGLVHISEMAEKPVADPREIIKNGEKRKFKIISIEPAAHRLGLSLKGVNKKEK